MKNIAIIPARGGSKRLPKKNILPLDGLPLVAHSIRYAIENTDVIDGIFVSTDAEEIAQVARDFGATVIYRPEGISGDFEPTVSALQHVLDNVAPGVENVIVLQPTNPLRPARLLSEALAVYNENNCDSLFTVTSNHSKLGKIEGGRFVPFNYEHGQRSQDLLPLFYENGLLYICSVSLIKKGSIASANAFPFVTEHVFSTVDIDTQEDFDYAAYLMNLYKNEL